MLTFNETTKAKYVARIAAHRAADEIIQGIGWDGRRGCAVGCTLDAYDHEAYERELGIPRAIARLEDSIHEGLRLEDALDWPGRFLSAVPCGVDLWRVWPRFAIWLLTVERPSDHGRAVAALYQRRLDGDEPTDWDWASAEAEADRAGETAAARAARASAWAAETAAARAAEWAAEAAGAARTVRSAGAARTVRSARAAAWAAEKAAYKRMADKLVELLQDEKGGEAC